MPKPPPTHSQAVYHCPACTCTQVGILVNNAGLSYDHPEYLDEVEDEFIADLVTINALVPTMVRRVGFAVITMV